MGVTGELTTTNMMLMGRSGEAIGITITTGK